MELELILTDVQPMELRHLRQLFCIVGYEVCVNNSLYSFQWVTFTGIIPFSRLGVFYANLGSAEISFVTRKRGPQNKW